jgi:branched-chain amino acid transport system ATP-binding protein
VQVLHGISLEVNEGEVVVVLGANGAGKTTTIRSICGMVSTRGSIELSGQDIVGKRTADVARFGVAHVPQGRGTFADLSVDDNMRLGAFTRKDKEVAEDIERWYEVFPVLGQRRGSAAGNLSGGEQQMLALGRALMSKPKLLLLDEPSLGLAPKVVQGLFERLGTIKADVGTTMLIVEQNANLALAIADRAYVLEAGTIALSGTAAELQQDDAVRRAYLGY